MIGYAVHCAPRLALFGARRMLFSDAGERHAFGDPGKGSVFGSSIYVREEKEGWAGGSVGGC